MSAGHAAGPLGAGGGATSGTAETTGSGAAGGGVTAVGGGEGGGAGGGATGSGGAAEQAVSSTTARAERRSMGEALSCPGRVMSTSVAVARGTWKPRRRGGRARRRRHPARALSR